MPDTRQSTTDTVKISIILPIYNVEGFLPTCLDSLLNQTYSNLEVIGVVDASPDNSLSILKEYAARDSRLIIKNLVYNVGVAEARNKGIAIATGDYITFVDSDDYVELDMLEKYWAEMDQLYDFVVSGLTMIHSDGQPNDLIIPQPIIVHGLKEFGPAYAYLDGTGVLTRPFNKLFKRAIITNNGIRFPNIALGEDTCFVLSYLLKVTTIKVCSFSSYNYLLHTSKTLSRGVQRSFTAVRYFLDLKFKLKNELMVRMNLAPETEEAFFVNNLLIIQSSIIALYSPKFPMSYAERKYELRKFRKNKFIKIYKNQDLGQRMNLTKIPICYLPIPFADWILTKFMRNYFSYNKAFVD